MGGTQITTVAVAALALATACPSSAHPGADRAADQPFLPMVEALKRAKISAVFRLTPSHRLASISHRFDHATVGFSSTRLVVPRGLPAELLIQTSVESITRQPPDLALCTPASFCRSRGLAVQHQCRDSGSFTVCEEKNPPGARDAIFPPGRFVLRVREFAPKIARVSLKAVFIRGFG